MKEDTAAETHAYVYDAVLNVIDLTASRCVLKELRRATGVCHKRAKTRSNQQLERNPKTEIHEVLLSCCMSSLYQTDE